MNYFDTSLLAAVVAGMLRSATPVVYAGIGEITVRIGAPVTFPPATSPDEIARYLESLVRSL